MTAPVSVLESSHEEIHVKCSVGCCHMLALLLLVLTRPKSFLPIAVLRVQTRQRISGTSWGQLLKHGVPRVWCLLTTLGTN